jgi:hypothetical protein
MALRNEEEGHPSHYAKNRLPGPRRECFQPRIKTRLCPFCGRTKATYLFGRSSLMKDGYSRGGAACQKRRKRELKTGMPRGYAWRGTLHRRIEKYSGIIH